ncbi:Retrovirus-related Pol polyprotein from transposon TNT 1-94 [Linum perenne]
MAPATSASADDSTSGTLINFTDHYANPLYLSPGDNLSVPIVSIKLSNDNYHIWSRSIKVALSIKNKTAFVDGSLPAPEITAQSLISYDSAAAIWKDLKQRFSQCDAIRVADLQARIASCDQGNNTVTQYFTNLKVLWEEYQQYRPLPTCDCSVGGTLCSVMKQVTLYQSNDYAIRFIRGLNSSFNVVRSQLLLMDPLPDVNSAFKCAIQLERQMKGSIAAAPTVDSIALATGYQNKGKAIAEGSLFCRYCKKDNHTIENCYRLKNKKARMAGQPTPSNSFAGSVTGDQSAQGNGVMHSDSFASPVVHNGTTPLSFSADEIARLKLILCQHSPASTSASSEIHANAITASTPPHNSGTFTLTSFAFHTKSLTNSEWIIDTGASDHICCSLSLFSCYLPTDHISVTLPDGSCLSATNIGSVKLVNGIVLSRVLFVPGFSFNLLSVSRLTQDMSVSVVFCAQQCHILDLLSQKKIGTASQIKGLYLLSPKPFHSFAANQSSPSSVPQCSSLAATTLNLTPQLLDLWHCRLGHPSTPRIQLIHRANPSVSVPLHSHCHVCHLAKQKALPFSRSSSHAVTPFELVHMDIWGPLNTPTHDGHSYFLTVVDDFSRCVWIFLMRNKSETRSFIESFCHMVKNQFPFTVKTIRSDQGAEFYMTSFFASNGISHQTSCVESAPQNGRVERKHQHLLAVARSLRFQSGLPLRFWGECVLHACYLINRIPTPILNNKSPFETLYNIAPTYSHLKVFGCLAYASTLSHGRTKFSPRSTASIFLGYRAGIKGFKLLDINTQKIFISRNVIFHEDILPYQSPAPNSGIDHVSIPNNISEIPSPCVTLESLSPIHFPDDDIFPDIPTSVDHQTTDHQVNDRTNESSSPNANSPHQEENLTHKTIPRRSTRITKPPSYLTDYHCELLKEKDNHSSLMSQSSHYPLSSYVSYNNLSKNYKQFVLNVSVEPEPQTYLEASKSKCWQRAMQEELQALEENGTWVISELPSGKRPIGCKWVYKVKFKSDGSVDRYKARLVAKGFTQIHGVDFTDTFSPVAKINSVKTLLAVAAVKEWHLHQMDVSNAFLHGDLDDEIYMDLPPGVTDDGNSKKVCKLLKSLYGLKQASRQWFLKFSNALKSEGFHQSAADHSMFIYSTNEAMVILLVYVDDIILAGNDLQLITNVKHKLQQHFKVKDLGKLKYFLGLEIARNADGISMCQRKYCLELISDSGFIDSKPSKTPVDYKDKLTAEMGTRLADGTEYRQLVGRLHYLTITRPDISYGVQQLSQFQSSPTDLHLQAAHKVIRYLKQSPGQGLFFSRNTDLRLSGYSDSDWASCPDTRRSTTGFCLFLGSSLLSWKTKKQGTVSRSSSEAEYRALAQLCCEVQWMVSLLIDLGVKHEVPVKLFCDNQSAIYIAQNPVFHERTKHIEIDCHVIRERLQNGLISLHHVPTEIQLADLFTKGLPAPRLRMLLAKLGVLDLFHPQLEGGC